jgi:L-arabinose transport system permease protein
MIFCFAAFGLMLHKSVFGRYALAIGGNKLAAGFAGINVPKTKIAIFTLQGLIAAFAGVILAARFTSGQPTTAVGLELQVISACVLGGVSLTGGVASMLGVIVGVFIMGTVNNAMNLKNIDAFWQYVVSGGILLAAVLFDKLKQRRRSR